MPLSDDPRKRERSLSNLKRGGAPPAAPGNKLAVRHGAYAKVAAGRLHAKALEVYEAIGEDVPLKEDGRLPAADGVAVRLLAECLVRLDDLGRYLTERGILDDAGNPRPALEVEGRLRREAADHCDALGMTPRSRAKLGLDLRRAESFDLAAFWAEQEARDD